MRSLRAFIAVFCVLFTLTAAAVPAKRIYRTFTQPDGSSVSLMLVGDEYGHHYLTDDGRIAVESAADGGFYFATLGNDGKVIASHLLATGSAERTPEQAAFLADTDDKAISEALAATVSPRIATRIAKAEAAASRNAPAMRMTVGNATGVGRFPGATFPTTGSPHALVILVEYPDCAFTLTDPKEYFTDMMSKVGFNRYGGTGCVEEYFKDASGGKFTPKFDVYGPVTLSQKMSYYGGNGYSGSDKNPQKMIVEACKALDSQIDFTVYDTDNDGYVDNVYVFYAGQGEADYGDANTVWPHSWTLSDAGEARLRLDGKTIDSYACSNEWELSKPTGIGTICHEFSHVLGLPDLYDTDYNHTLTPQSWSILDYGPYNNDGRTPPTYSVFERNAMGWSDMIILDQTPRTVSLEHILDTNTGCIIKTTNENEFFLFENRQQKGWDTYIPGHGMLIWHILYDSTRWRQNYVNNSSSKQYVDIEEANNRPTGADADLPGYAFPGPSGKTSFTDSTTPSMLTWSKAKLNTPITNIAENDGIITFNVCGGDPGIQPPAKPEIAELTSNSFVATWEAVSGADDYLLTVETDENYSEITDACDFGSRIPITLPAGWSSDSNNYYDTTGNYGDTAPSIKLKNDGHYVMTAEYDTDIVRVSFWAKAMGASISNPLEIYAVGNDTETLIGSMASWSNSKGQTYTFNVDRRGVRQLKLVYRKVTNGTNMGLDDIVVTCSDGSNYVLEDYNGISTAGATQMVVNNLPEGIRRFSFSVQSVKNGIKSEASAPCKVELPVSGVIEVEAPQATVTVSGYTIIATGTTIDVYDLCGRSVARGVENVTLAPGVYIIVDATGTTRKIAL